MGIVFQSFNLFPHMTVLKNITLSPIKVHGLSQESAVQRAEELLDQFGLLDKINEYPDRLSGGQQQRVAIVRALVTQPELMLFDEVTSALDPELVAEVLEAIRGLKAAGMTMIIATHEMGFARDVADRVCFLDAGVILEAGTPEQVFSNPQQPRNSSILATDRRRGPDCRFAERCFIEPLPKRGSERSSGTSAAHRRSRQAGRLRRAKVCFS